MSLSKCWIRSAKLRIWPITSETSSLLAVERLRLPRAKSSLRFNPIRAPRNVKLSPTWRFNVANLPITSGRASFLGNALAIAAVVCLEEPSLRFWALRASWRRLISASAWSRSTWIAASFCPAGVSSPSFSSACLLLAAAFNWSSSALALFSRSRIWRASSIGSRRVNACSLDGSASVLAFGLAASTAAALCSISFLIWMAPWISLLLLALLNRSSNMLWRCTAWSYVACCCFCATISSSLAGATSSPRYFFWVSSSACLAALAAWSSFAPASKSNAPWVSLAGPRSSSFFWVVSILVVRASSRSLSNCPLVKLRLWNSDLAALSCFSSAVRCCASVFSAGPRASSCFWVVPNTSANCAWRADNSLYLGISPFSIAVFKWPSNVSIDCFKAGILFSSICLWLANSSVACSFSASVRWSRETPLTPGCSWSGTSIPSKSPVWRCDCSKSTCCCLSARRAASASSRSCCFLRSFAANSDAPASTAFTSPLRLGKPCKAPKMGDNSAAPIALSL